MLNKKFYILFLLFSLTSGLYIYNHRLDLNPDAVSYIDIAKFYQVVDFKSAINAYWSPGFSWLLIIFKLFGNWLTASKLAIFFSSLFWFVSSFYLAQTIFKNIRKSILVLIFLVIFPGSYEIWRLITPDLVFSGFINIWLIYLFKLIDRRSNSWLKFGILTGSGFLIKSFLLPFSIIFLGILFILKLVKLKPLIYCFSGLMVIIGIWGLVIYQKYHHFTFSTSFNVTYKHHVKGQEFEFLLKPMNPYVGTSYWTDPSDFSSLQLNIGHIIKAIKLNLTHAGEFLIKNLHIGLIFLLGLLFKRKCRQIELLSLFTIIWIFLYSTIFIEARYLWPIITPLLILILYPIKNNYLGKIMLVGYFIITLGLFTKIYIKYLPSDQNSIWHQQISTHIQPPCILMSDIWDRGLYIAYLSGCKYYGISQTAFADKNIKELLNKETTDGNVTHFLTFNSEKYRQSELIMQKMGFWYFDGKKIGLYKNKLLPER